MRCGMSVHRRAKTTELSAVRESTARRSRGRRCSLPGALAAVGARRVGVRDESGHNAGVARQLEMVDARVIGQAEVPALHRVPRRDDVIGDVLLVDIAVAGEEGRLVVEQLAG